jgi:hypothetical protein
LTLLSFSTSISYRTSQLVPEHSAAHIHIWWYSAQLSLVVKLSLLLWRWRTFLAYLQWVLSSLFFSRCPCGSQQVSSLPHAFYLLYCFLWILFNKWKHLVSIGQENLLTWKPLVP